MQTLHGSVVDVAGAGVFLRGPSASGKSDLAMRLMDRGAVLVADDQVLITPRPSGLKASAPDTLYGLLEVRGVGIVSLPAIKSTMLRLVVDLVELRDVPRLPEQVMVVVQGRKIANLKLHAFDASTPIKIELAMQNLARIGNKEPQHG